MTCKYCKGTGRQELATSIVDCLECKPDLTPVFEAAAKRCRDKGGKPNTLRGIPFAPADYVIGPSGPGIQQGLTAWLPDLPQERDFGAMLNHLAPDGYTVEVARERLALGYRVAVSYPTGDRSHRGAARFVAETHGGPSERFELLRAAVFHCLDVLGWKDPDAT